MSWEVVAEVVPFVIHSLCVFNDEDDVAENIRWISDPYNVYGRQNIAEEDIPDSFTLNGWECLTGKMTDLGKKGRVGGRPWIKDDKTVWIVNESHYANVGYYDIAVVANTREELEEFLQDHGYAEQKKEIEETEVVMEII